MRGCSGRRLQWKGEGCYCSYLASSTFKNYPSLLPFHLPCSMDHTVMDGHMGRVFALKYHPTDPRVLVSAGWDDTVQFWDTRSKHSVRCTIRAVGRGCSVGAIGRGGATVSGQRGEGGATVSGQQGEGGATVSGQRGEGGATVSGQQGEGGATVSGQQGEGGATVSGQQGEGGATVSGQWGRGRGYYTVCAWQWIVCVDV